MTIEIGEHEAKPLNYQFGQSGKKNTEMVSITFQFLSGPNEGKRISYNGYFTEKTAKRTMDSLEYCGWDGVDLTPPLEGFGSKNVMLVVENERGNDGNEYPVVAWVNRLFSRGPAKIYDKEETKSLADRMAAVNAERRRENAEKRGESASVDPFGNG